MLFLKASSEPAPRWHLQLQDRSCARGFVHTATVRSVASALQHCRWCFQELYYVSERELTPVIGCAWHPTSSVDWRAVLMRSPNTCVSVLQKKRPNSITPPPSGVPTNGKGLVRKHAQQGPAHRKPAKKGDADRSHSGPGKKRSAPSQDPDVVSTFACCLPAMWAFPLIYPDRNSVPAAKAGAATSGRADPAFRQETRQPSLFLTRLFWMWAGDIRHRQRRCPACQASAARPRPTSSRH